MRNQAHHQNGFTLIELLSVVAVIAIILTIAVPTGMTQIHRTRVTGAVGEVAMLLTKARQEAVRTGSPVVVRLSLDEDLIFAFVNFDEDPDFRFDSVFRTGSGLGEGAGRSRRVLPTRTLDSRRSAVDKEPALRALDYEIARLRLPQLIEFGGVTTAAREEDRQEQVGFSRPRNGGQDVAVFLPDGSIQDTGAFHIRDWRDNFFEVRVATKATASAVVLKYHDAPPWGSPPGFFPQGRHEATGTPLWQWK